MIGAGPCARARSASAAVVDDDGRRRCCPSARSRYDTLVIAVGSESNDFGVPGRRRARDRRSTRRARPSASTAGCSPRACAPTRARRRGGEGVVEDRDHRRGRDRRRARGGDPADDARARGLRPRPPRSRARHPDHGRSRRRRASCRRCPRRSPPRRPSCSASSTSTCASTRRSSRSTDEAVQTASGERYRGRPRRVGGRHPRAGAGSPACGLETNRANQLVVAQTLQSTRRSDVFALGDCAACPWPEAGPKARSCRRARRWRTSRRRCWSQVDARAPRRQAAAGVPASATTARSCRSASCPPSAR